MQNVRVNGSATFCSLRVGAHVELIAAHCDLIAHVQPEDGRASLDEQSIKVVAVEGRDDPRGRETNLREEESQASFVVDFILHFESTFELGVRVELKIIHVSEHGFTTDCQEASAVDNP